MNISIRKQLMVVFAGLIVSLFLANFLVNTFFLEDFYYIQKQKVLREAYEILNEKINDFGIMGTEDTKAYEQMCNENGISFVVTNED